MTPSSRFLEKYKRLLDESNLPSDLQIVLADKIINQTFDAGTYVEFQDIVKESYSDNESDFDDKNTNGCSAIIDDSKSVDECLKNREGIDCFTNCKFSLNAKKELKAGETVILIDHMW